MIRKHYFTICFTNNVENLCQIDVVSVPGCFEIPLQAKRMANKYDVIVAIGVIIKGETYHFECMSKQHNRWTNADTIRMRHTCS